MRRATFVLEKQNIMFATRQTIFVNGGNYTFSHLKRGRETLLYRGCNLYEVRAQRAEYKLEFFLLAFLDSDSRNGCTYPERENYLGETELQPQLVSGKYILYMVVCVCIILYMYNIYTNCLNNYLYI